MVTMSDYLEQVMPELNEDEVVQEALAAGAITAIALGGTAALAGIIAFIVKMVKSKIKKTDKSKKKDEDEDDEDDDKKSEAKKKTEKLAQTAEQIADTSLDEVEELLKKCNEFIELLDELPDNISVDLSNIDMIDNGNFSSNIKTATDSMDAFDNIMTLINELIIKVTGKKDASDIYTQCKAAIDGFQVPNINFMTKASSSVDKNQLKKYFTGIYNEMPDLFEKAREVDTKLKEFNNENIQNVNVQPIINDKALGGVAIDESLKILGDSLKPKAIAFANILIELDKITETFDDVTDAIRKSFPDQTTVDPQQQQQTPPPQQGQQQQQQNQQQTQQQSQQQTQQQPQSDVKVDMLIPKVTNQRLDAINKAIMKNNYSAAGKSLNVMQVSISNIRQSKVIPVNDVKNMTVTLGFVERILSILSNNNYEVTKYVNDHCDLMIKGLESVMKSYNDAINSITDKGIKDRITKINNDIVAVKNGISKA